MRSCEEVMHDGVNFVVLHIGKSVTLVNELVMALSLEEARVENKEGWQWDGGTVLIGKPHAMYQGVHVVKLIVQMVPQGLNLVVSLAAC